MSTRRQGEGDGLYRMVQTKPGGITTVSIGNGAGELLAAIEHEEAASIFEQFEALQTIEARNAFGDALLLMVRLMPEGLLYSYEPSGFSRDVEQGSR